MSPFSDGRNGPTGRVYSKPPIREALIDFRTSFPVEPKLTDVSEIGSRIQDVFPTANEIKTIEVSTAPGTPRVERTIGSMYRSSDGKYVFQARLEGFSFSRLTPYVNWDDLRSQALVYWKIYQEVTRPQGVNRVAVRYINQIDVPGSEIELDHYFLTAPRIGPSLPQSLSQFLMQLHLPQPDIQAESLVTQTMLVPPPTPGVTSFMLDIDLFVNRPMSIEDAWNELEVLRVRKNSIFEGCITDKARELFD